MFVAELRKAAKSAKWVRFPLPAHSPMARKLRVGRARNLAAGLNVPIEFALNFFAANREDRPFFVGGKGKGSRQVWIVFI